MKTVPRKRRALVALTALGLLCLGASSVAAARQAGSVLTGRVTDGERGLFGVTVTLLSTEPGSRNRVAAKAKTDGEGNYRIEGVKPGRYQAVPFAPAHVADERGSGWPPGGKLVNVLAGETIEGIDFRIERGGVITGRVTDADGQPVVGEWVNVARAEPRQEGDNTPVSLAAFQRPATDDRGVYRAYGLAPGRYRVSVGEGAEGGAPRGARRRFFTRTFYPDTTDEAQARVVEVAAGSEAEGVDITVGRPTRTFRAAGRVVHAETGQPAAGVRIGAGTLDRSGRAGSYGGTGDTDARGEFQIEGLAPGRYFAGAFPPSTNVRSHDPSLYSEPVTFEVADADVSGLQVKLRRGATVSGVVHVEGVTDRATLVRLLAGMRVYGWTQAPDRLTMPGASPSAPVAADGGFRLEGVRPGRLNLNFGPDVRGFTRARVEHNGVDVQREGIQVAAGAEVSGVRVVLVRGSATVRGQVSVTNGTLPPNARVHVYARRVGVDGDAQFSRPAEVDARGRFQIEALPAGTYELRARAFLMGGGRTQFEGQPLQISVADNSEQQVTLAIELVAPTAPPPRP